MVQCPQRHDFAHSFGKAIRLLFIDRRACLYFSFYRDDPRVTLPREISFLALSLTDRVQIAVYRWRRRLASSQTGEKKPRHHAIRIPPMALQSIRTPRSWGSDPLGRRSCTQCTLVWLDFRHGRHWFHQHRRASTFRQLLYRFIQRIERGSHGDGHSSSKHNELCYWIRVSLIQPHCTDRF